MRGQVPPPCSTEWPGWRGTPPAQPGSPPPAPARRHPAPRWLCPPRTGPKRHHRWLPRAVGEPRVQSCTIPCHRAHGLPNVQPRNLQRGKPWPHYSIPAGAQEPSHVEDICDHHEPRSAQAGRDTWHRWSGVSWALSSAAEAQPSP